MSVETIKTDIERKEFVKRIKARRSMKNLPIHNFDEVGEVNGKINKFFTMCEGSYLIEMYKELTSNPNNNFITCVDECLYDYNISLDDFSKTKISTILKLSNSTQYENRHKSSEAERSTKSELICSRVANLYNIKTEYVAPIRNNPFGCIVIDFLRGDEKLEDFTEFTGKNPSVYLPGSSIRRWMEPFLEGIIHRVPKLDNKTMNEIVRPMMKEMVKQYIFKKYIVHDADFCAVNFGIVSDTATNHMSVSPIYDFERCLLPGIRSGQGVGLEEDIHFLVKHWPGLLKSVLKDFTLSNEKKHEIKATISKFESDVNRAKEFYNIIDNSTYNVLTTSRIEFAHQNIDYDTVQEDREFIN